MQVEIISTGDEVLTGFITDTNAPWLSQELLELGIYTYRRHTVSDHLADLRDIISERAACCDVLLVSGGLGPTSDDNTAQAAAQAAGVELVLNPSWLAELRQRFQVRQRPMPENNAKQALVPSGATIIPNSCGTACGFCMQIGRATCFFTPGVPHELQAMYRLSIRPYLIQHLSDVSLHQVRRLFVFGISESHLASLLDALPAVPSLTLGYRAAYPLLEVKVIMNCAAAAPAQCRSFLQQVRAICAPYLLCEDDPNLPQRIAESAGNAGICLADNVTGGLLGAELSKGLQLCRMIVTCERLSAEQVELTMQGHADLVCAVFDNEHQGAVHFYLHDHRRLRLQHIVYQLHLTHTHHERAAIALLGQGFMLRCLSGQPPLRPQGCPCHELS